MLVLLGSSVIINIQVYAQFNYLDLSTPQKINGMQYMQFKILEAII